MRVRLSEQATDCHSPSMDWTALGARILQVATLAGAVHQMEQAAGTSLREPAPRAAQPGATTVGSLGAPTAGQRG